MAAAENFLTKAPNGAPFVHGMFREPGASYLWERCMGYPWHPTSFGLEMTHKEDRDGIFDSVDLLDYLYFEGHCLKGSPEFKEDRWWTL
jgi:hypothetical protein